MVKSHVYGILGVEEEESARLERISTCPTDDMVYIYIYKPANAAIILSMRTVPYISTYVYSWAEHTIIIIIATYIWCV